MVVKDLASSFGRLFVGKVFVRCLIDANSGMETAVSVQAVKFAFQSIDTKTLMCVAFTAARRN